MQILKLYPEEGTVANIRKCKDYIKVTHECLNPTTTVNQHSGMVTFLHLNKKCQKFITLGSNIQAPIKPLT